MQKIRHEKTKVCADLICKGVENVEKCGKHRKNTAFSHKTCGKLCGKCGFAEEKANCICIDEYAIHAKEKRFWLIDFYEFLRMCLFNERIHDIL